MADITSKELSNIQDQLDLEENLVIKYKSYAQSTADTALKDKFDSIAQKHQKHFEALYSQIK